MCVCVSVCVCLCVCVSIFLCAPWGNGCVCPPILLTGGGSGSPFQVQRRKLSAGQLPKETFCQEARAGGRKNPNKPVLQAGCCHCFSREGWLGREEERRRVKSLDKIIKGRSHLPAPGPRLPPSPPESSSLQHNPAQRGKGREGREEVNKMAFLPQKNSFLLLFMLLMLHLNTGNYLIKLFCVCVSVSFANVLIDSYK